MQSWNCGLRSRPIFRRLQRWSKSGRKRVFGTYGNTYKRSPTLRKDSDMQQQTVVIVGAGGKMGARAVEKIGKESRFRVLLCESDAVRARRLEKDGFQVILTESALPEADFVLMAVPDALIGRIAGQLVPHMKDGATLIMLDACAAYLNQLPNRATLTFMITHPCHPPFFFEQSTPEARGDYFGGVALQDILVSLV